MRRHTPHLCVLAALTLVLVGGAQDALRNFVIDSRFALLSRNASGEVAVIAIDSESLEKIGVWPWPRRLHAELVDRLNEIGVSEIAFDVDFSSPSDDSSDRAFAAALRRSNGSVILPTFKQWIADEISGNRVHETWPLDAFRELSWPASVNVLVDSDGRVRRYPLSQPHQQETIPSLAALLAGSRYQKGKSFLIDFSIKSDTIPVISFVDVLRGEKSWLQAKLENRKVVVGATALELGDRLNVPNGRILPGVTVQALASESILQDRAIPDPSRLMGLAGALFIFLLMFATWNRYGFTGRVISAVSTSLIVEAFAFGLQANSAVALDTSLLHAAAVAYLIVGAAQELDLRELLSTIAEKRFQKVAMSVGDGLVCVDRTGLITFWNPGAEAIFGVNSSEARGQEFDRILAPSNKLDRPDTAALTFDLMQAGRNDIVELEWIRKDGSRTPVEARFFSWEGTTGIEYGVLLRDIAQRKRGLERIQYLAQVDVLTGLANRHTLREHLDAALMTAEAENGQVALLVLDLDKFKDVNDMLGHTGGDELLTAAAARLKMLSHGSAFVARLGGDEFAIVLEGTKAAADSAQFAEEIGEAFRSEPFEVQGRHLHVQCSIGIAVYPADTTSPEQLLSFADLALYQAKARGRGQSSFFTQEIKDALAARLSLEAELARASQNEEFELFFQPQFALADRRLIGAEALIRWRHPTRGLLSPAEFMAAVHSSALSNKVAWWVMETACGKASEWERSGNKIRVAVNLSPSQLQSAEFSDEVARVLSRTGLSSHLLELEVTEDILLNDDDRYAEMFRKIHRTGVQLSFDDFGTGYGSLSYLKKFPFDRLKIDRSFVQNLCLGTDDAAIVSSTISLGKMLGRSVIAEGIENAATVDFLAAMGCAEGQGYFFGHPVPAGEFERTWFDGARDTAMTANAA